MFIADMENREKQKINRILLRYADLHNHNIEKNDSVSVLLSTEKDNVTNEVLNKETLTSPIKSGIEEKKKNEAPVNKETPIKADTKDPTKLSKPIANEIEEGGFQLLRQAGFWYLATILEFIQRWLPFLDMRFYLVDLAGEINNDINNFDFPLKNVYDRLKQKVESGTSGVDGSVGKGDTINKDKDSITSFFFTTKKEKIQYHLHSLKNQTLEMLHGTDTQVRDRWKYNGTFPINLILPGEILIRLPHPLWTIAYEHPPISSLFPDLSIFTTVHSSGFDTESKSYTGIDTSEVVYYTTIMN